VVLRDEGKKETQRLVLDSVRAVSGTGTYKIRLFDWASAFALSGQKDEGHHQCNNDGQTGFAKTVSVCTIARQLLVVGIGL
jgi:hypothetical protein